MRYFTYLKVIGWGWFYLSTVLDDFSRYIIAWKLCTTMKAEDVTATLDLALRRLWMRALRRRSQRDRTSWERCAGIANEWLPRPKILHPWPSDRFAVKHPRWEPYAGKLHVRICAGGAQQ